MLPAPKPDRLSLADVMPSCLSTVVGEGNRLGLPPGKRAVVLLVDGLGSAALKARAGHARTLISRLGKRSVIESGFPTTTAAAIATIMTGTAPGQHGLVGYSALDTVNDRVVNMLSGWDKRIEPAAWQLERTVFERAAARGVGAVSIGPERFRKSGFSAAVLRGSTYVGAKTIQERAEVAVEWLRTSGENSLVYVYVPELDMASHATGWQSQEWTEALESLDHAVRTLEAGLAADDGMIVTADHGVLDVPAHGHVLFDSSPGLIEGVRHVAGEPRCLQLHFEPGLGESDRAALVQRWRDSESNRAWVATRAEATGAGWFGTVTPEVEPRIGDVLVAARKQIAYYDGRTADDRALAMVGQHGSWTPAELNVPLLRFGAFA